MSPPQFIPLPAMPTAFGRSAGLKPEPWGRVDRAGRSLPKSAAERTSRSDAGLSKSTESVLSARQFEVFLERERSLADRGTRRFSLLVVRRQSLPAGRELRRERDALAELALQACQRLRSTDIVGRRDADRVEILLTDTEPAGAQVVARWVEEIETELGLDLDKTIYVYPAVEDPSTGDEHDRGRHGGVGSDGSGNGRLTRRAEGRASTSVAPSTAGRRVTNGKALDGHVNGHPNGHLDGHNGHVNGHNGHVNGHNGHVNGHPNGHLNGHNGHLNGHAPATTPEAPVRTEAVVDPRWLMEDLWPHLGVPTPFWKRSLDILLSIVALLLLSPLFALIAIAIRIDSAGPVIFRQLRAGQGGRPFVFYKFRSMTADAEERRAALADLNEQDGPIFKIRKDPRITRLGRLLRRASIDELPQLWNVLKGDISLVGPRSATLDEVGQYERWQRRRLCVTGGITCTWQVSGRSEISFREWMRLDVRYVACRTIWLDLRLLVLTLPAVISGRGAS